MFWRVVGFGWFGISCSAKKSLDIETQLSGEHRLTMFRTRLLFTSMLGKHDDDDNYSKFMNYFAHKY